MLTEPIVVLCGAKDIGGFTKDLVDDIPEGCVYFILSPKLEMVKIGRTVDVRQRFYDIQVANGDELQLLGVYPWQNNAERGFHSRFREYRVRGEWFSVEGRLKRFIEGEFAPDKALDKIVCAPRRHPACSLTIEEEKSVVNQYNSSARDQLSACVAECAARHAVSIATIQGTLEKYGALDGQDNVEKLRASIYAQQMRDKYNGDNRTWDLPHIEDKQAWAEEFEAVHQGEG